MEQDSKFIVETTETTTTEETTNDFNPFTAVAIAWLGWAIYQICEIIRPIFIPENEDITKFIIKILNIVTMYLGM